MSRTLLASATVGLTLAIAGPAAAQPAVGIVPGPTTDAIVQLDTDAPTTFTSVRGISGLTGAERIVGIDYRWLPAAASGASAGLYGLGVDPATGSSHVYRIDASTGQASPVGAGFTLAVAGDYGVDFNPAVDRIRIVTSADGSYRAHPDTGALAATDTALSPAGSKVAAGAYDRVNVAPTTPASPTTLYVIDATNDRLATQGSINSTPQSPNTGVLNAVGPLGVDVTEDGANFDIAFDGKAYATLTTATGTPGLYTLELATGAATLAGRLPVELSGFAIVPAPTPTPTPTPTPAPTPTPTPTPADTAAPKVTLSVTSSVRRSSLLKGLKVTVTPSESVRLEASLNGRVTRATAARALAGKYNLELIGTSLPLAAGPRTITLRPKAALVPMVKRTQKIQLRVTATDAAGNATLVTKTISVKR